MTSDHTKLELLTSVGLMLQSAGIVDRVDADIEL